MAPPKPATKRATQAANAGKPKPKAAPAPPARPPSRAAKAVKGGAPKSSATRGGARRGEASNKSTTSRAKKPAKAARPVKPVRVPVVSYRIKELDPFQKCGAGTSVQSLYRVDESVDGALTYHMVFFDRHGWYCEHGRNCPAVTHARKFDASAAR